MTTGPRWKYVRFMAVVRDSQLGDLAVSWLMSDLIRVWVNGTGTAAFEYVCNGRPVDIAEIRTRYPICVYADYPTAGIKVRRKC